LKDALFRLEPYDGKLSRTVLKGERGCEAPDLPDLQVGFFDFFQFLLEGKKSKNPTQLLPLLGLAKFRFNNHCRLHFAKYKYTLKTSGQ
jgi:hypothetical protein